MNKLIVIGYQGIGKSTLARRNYNFVDLESSSFFINGVRSSDWYEAYCQVAEHLALQGRIVFVSRHEVVRRKLLESRVPVVCCVPSPSLRIAWVRKLHDRWMSTNLSKDYKAYMNALDRYTENIREISNSGFPVITIDNINYSLENEIEKFLASH